MNTTVHFNDNGKPFYVEIHREAPIDAPKVRYFSQGAYDAGMSGNPIKDTEVLGCFVYRKQSPYGSMCDWVILTLNKLPFPLPSYLEVVTEAWYSKVMSEN